MATRMSQLLKDIDLTLVDIIDDASSPKLEASKELPIIPVGSPIKLSSFDAVDAKEALSVHEDEGYDDLLDTYGGEDDDAATIDEKGESCETAEQEVPDSTHSPSPVEDSEVPPQPKETKPAPTLTNFPPNVSMQAIRTKPLPTPEMSPPLPAVAAPAPPPMAQPPVPAHAPPAPPTHIVAAPIPTTIQPPAAIDYQMFQTPGARAPPLPNGTFDDHRISMATSAFDYPSSPTISTAATSTMVPLPAEDLEALKQQLERAQHELQTQMYMNKLLVATQQLQQQRAQAAQVMAMAGPLTVTPVTPKDRSDTVSVNSGKSAKSTSSGWFGMSRSKSSSKSLAMEKKKEKDLSSTKSAKDVEKALEYFF